MNKKTTFRNEMSEVFLFGKACLSHTMGSSEVKICQSRWCFLMNSRLDTLMVTFTFSMVA